jgi:hypothetical protein
LVDEFAHVAELEDGVDGVVDFDHCGGVEGVDGVAVEKEGGGNQAEEKLEEEQVKMGGEEN